GAAYGNHSPWPGIDVRADGGWVVAPGNRGRGGEWSWRLGGFATAGPLPEVMVGKLEPAQRHGRRASDAATVAFIEASPTETSMNVMQKFAAELEWFRNASRGSRHDALVHVVGWAFGMTALDLRWAVEQIKTEWVLLTVGEGREDEVAEVAAWVVGQ